MCAVVLFVASPNEDDIRQESALLTKISKIGIMKGLMVLLFANRICSQRKRDNNYNTRHYDVKTYKCSDKCIMLKMGGVTEGARGGQGRRQLADRLFSCTGNRQARRDTECQRSQEHRRQLEVGAGCV